MRVIGLMSGTSLDGVDAALVDFSSGQPRTVATHWRAYSDQLRRQALHLQSAQPDELHLTALLANDLAHCYAATVAELLDQAAIAPQQIRAIGCHGQTLRHQPAHGYSLQANNPALLAELSGIAVVADFRSRDLAAGGQGAPLVPAYHAAVFADPQLHRVILNLGGIANLTELKPSAPVRGFDSGPGNLLMDAWIERHCGQRYDRDGAWASAGRVQNELLHALLAHEFFQAAPPKSCGRDEFNLAWLDRHLRGDENAVAAATADIQATLLEFTARTVTDAIRTECRGVEEVYVCGGGAHNRALMARLEEILDAHARIRLASTDFLDQPADWVEAVAFAWLAWRTLNGEPGNLPAVTGARGLRCLGAIYPA